MRVAAIIWCAEISGLQVYLFRRTYPDLIKNHMEGPAGFPAMLAELIESKHVKINLSKNSIEFWNGSKIFLCHCQYEKDMYGYQGAEIHALLFDELTHFTDTIYRFLRGRCRLGGLQLPEKYKGQFPRIANGSNPGGVGHNWVRATFVDFAPPMAIKKAERKEGGMLRQYIPARLEDNPTLLENDPDYEMRLEGLGNEALIKAMRSGDWNIVAGGMFDDVWIEKHHAIRPFPIPKGWRIDRAFDWGSSKPFGVAWFAESDGTEIELAGGDKKSYPRGTVIQIAEWYGWNGEVNKGCRMLASEIAKGIVDKEKVMGLAGRVRPGPADSAIFTTENGNCIADDMARSGIKWEAADKGPGSRVNGWEKVRQMLKAATVHPMEEPGYLVFETCRQTIRTLPVLPRDEKKTDDVDSASEDHLADLIRYRLTTPRRTASTRDMW